jgi:hypothetical protein
MQPVETIFVDGHLVGHIYHDHGYEAFNEFGSYMGTWPTRERPRPLEYAHRWSPCGIAQKDRPSPASVKTVSPWHERCNRSLSPQLKLFYSYVTTSVTFSRRKLANYKVSLPPKKAVGRPEAAR